MKSSHALAAAFALALGTGGFAALQAAAQDSPAAPQISRTISVTGTGRASLAPDLAILSLGVTNNAATAREALDANSKAMTAVVDGLKTLGFGVTEMQTTGLALNPVYDYSGSVAKLTGYQAVNGINLRVKDVARLGEILDIAVTAGANVINSLTFDVADKVQATSDARVAAMQEAKAKADLMAGALGASVGRPISISESYTSNPGPMPTQTMNAAAVAVPIAAGQVGLEATVSVVFELN